MYLKIVPPVSLCVSDRRLKKVTDIMLISEGIGVGVRGLVAYGTGP